MVLPLPSVGVGVTGGDGVTVMISVHEIKYMHGISMYVIHVHCLWNSSYLTSQQ